MTMSPVFVYQTYCLLYPHLEFHTPTSPEPAQSFGDRWSSGRQLFETTKIIDDEKYYEEGSTEIDLSKYTREEREKERRKEEEEDEKRREGMLADEGD